MLDEGDFEERMRQSDFYKAHPESVNNSNRVNEYIEHAKAGGYYQTLSRLQSFGIEETAKLDEEEFLWHRTFDPIFRLHCRKGDLDGVSKAIASGVDVDSYDVDGDTPLMIAAAWNRAEVVKMLLEVGADPTPKNSSGFTASSLARRFGSTESYQLLQPYDHSAATVNREDNDDVTDFRWHTLNLLSYFQREIVPVQGQMPLDFLIGDLFSYSVFFMSEAKESPYAYDEEDVEYINHLLAQVHSLQELQQLVAFETLHNDWEGHRVKSPLSAHAIMDLVGSDYFEYYETRLNCWKSYIQVFVRLGCLIAEYCGILPERCLVSIRTIVNDLNLQGEQREAVFVRNAAKIAFEESGYTVSAEALEKPIQDELDDNRMPSYTLLARRVYEKNRSWAIQLCEAAIEEGDVDDAPFFLGWLLESDDASRSKELYQICIDNGFYYGAANNLARLIESDDPGRAEELYQLSVDAGNTLTAARNLAKLIQAADVERAKNLYQMAIDAGDEYASTFQLALLVEKSNPEQAKLLYSRSISAGDTYASSSRLADLLKDEDPSRAADLYQQAIDAGNVSAYSKLARLMSDTDRERSIELCEMAVQKGDVNDGPFFLAWLLEGSDIERSKELYQVCVDNGYCYGAAYNLAIIIQAEDSDRAIGLYRKAASDGRIEAFNAAGVLLMQQDPDEAAKLFEEGIKAGDRTYAACNLGHMLALSDTNRAVELYKLSLANESADEVTESLIGLHLILAADSPDESARLLNQARERNNFQTSIDFMASYYDCVDASYASRVRKCLDKAITQ